MSWSKKSLIILASIGVLFLSPPPSFAVCIMPPGYDPAADPDINLDLSGWEEIEGLLDQFVFVHDTDPNAPQLSTLIEGICDLAVTSVNMISGTDRPPEEDIPDDYANLVCLSTPAGAPVLVPNSGYNMGGGCEAAVLYATSRSIVLKYTPDDNIVKGYTVYLHNFHVDPGLLAYYNEHQGSGSAPCLSGGERIGLSSGETCVAIRDTGTFMDPRWQEWWNQCPASARDLLLKLINLCTEVLPPLRLCPAPFPDPKECCPLTTEPKPGVLELYFNRISRIISELISYIVNIEAWVTVDSDLKRSEQLADDTNYFWAQPAPSIEECDSRRIATVDEEPEETPGGKMCPGAALRIVPPDYRPSYTWKDHYDEELKWDLPLTALHVPANTPATGRSKTFHPLFATASPDLWRWLINTPGLEERIGSTDDSLAEETDNASGAVSISQSSNLSRTTIFPSGKSNSSQTIGIQTIDSAWSDLVQNETQLAATNGEEVCLFITATCSANNWNVHCDVGFSCLVSQCGHYYAHLNGEMIGHGNCTPAGVLTWDGSVSPGTDSATFTATIHGDPAECKPGPAASCTIDFDANGNGSCTASDGSPCPAPPEEVEACNLPYNAPPEPVCTETGRLDADISGNLFEWIINLIRGQVSVHLIPRFPLLENVYYLTGILTEKYKDLKNEGVGGVFNAFLPPGSADFSTLDAPGTVNMTYHIHIDWRCIGWEDFCIPGTDPPICWDVCIWDPPDLNVGLPIINPEGPLLIWGGGSQTPALDTVQQWLAPPQ